MRRPPNHFSVEGLRPRGPSTTFFLHFFTVCRQPSHRPRRGHGPRNHLYRRGRWMAVRRPAALLMALLVVLSAVALPSSEAAPASPTGARRRQDIPLLGPPARERYGPPLQRLPRDGPGEPDVLRLGGRQLHRRVRSRGRARMDVLLRHKRQHHRGGGGSQPDRGRPSPGRRVSRDGYGDDIGPGCRHPHLRLSEGKRRGMISLSSLARASSPLSGAPAYAPSLTLSSSWRR